MGKRVRRAVSPETFHGAAGLALALLGAAAILYGLHLPLAWPPVLAAWLAAVNVTTFGYYGYDKARARLAGRRVPEVVLHGLALVGGSAGAWLAMRFFRHKTVKGRFRLAFWCIVALQLAVCVWVIFAWQSGHAR
jgi:uncharacterized membrane protein YsdA (DUF1294 family)